MKKILEDTHLIINSKIFKNTLILLISGVLTQAGVFLVMILIARNLGPESFGKVTFSSTLVSYFLLFGGFGLALYGTKNISRRLIDAPKIITSVIFVRLIASVFSILVLSFGLWVFGIQDEKAILVLIYSLEIILSIFLLDWVFQGKEKMLYVAYSKIISVFVMAIIILNIDLTVSNIYWVAIAQIIGIFFSIIFLLININKTGCVFTIEFSKPCILDAFHEGRAILIANFFNLIMFNSSILLLGFYSTDEAVGEYGAFCKISMLIINFSGAYYNAIFPLAAKYYKTSIESLIELKRISINISLFFAIPISFIIIAFPVEIITILFGKSYAGEALSFRLMGIFILLNLINTPFGRGLLVTDRQNSLLRIMIISSLSNLLAALILIPKFGVAGAVCGLIVGELVAFPKQYYAFANYVNVNLSQIIGYIFYGFFSLLPMIFLFYIFELNWIFSIIMGLLIYAFIAIRFFKY